MLRWIAEIWRLSRLAWRYRRLRDARVSGYASVALRASGEVERLRRRYGGKNFIWTFPTNHVLDSGGDYVAMWQVVRNTLAPRLELRFLYCGPLRRLEDLIADDFFDDHLNGVKIDCPKEKDDGNEFARVHKF